MNEATWALVGVTLVLALLTGWYAVEMHRTVKRMDRAREETYRPILTLQLVPWIASLVKIRIQNVGNGAASNIKGTIESILNTGTASIPWSYPLLASGKYEEFGFPMPSDAKPDERFRIETIRTKVIEVKAKFTYNSIFGNAYVLEDSIQVREVTETWIASRILATEDHPDRLLPRIAKALDELVKNTSK